MDLQESCKIQDQVVYFKKILWREKQNHLPPTEKVMQWLYTVGKKTHQGKNFIRSIKFLVKLKANVIPCGSILLCSETETFSLGKTEGTIRSNVHE